LVSKKQIMLYNIILNNRLLALSFIVVNPLMKAFLRSYCSNSYEKLLTEHICITLDPNPNTCHCALELMECLFENFLPFDIFYKSSIQV